MDLWCVVLYVTYTHSRGQQWLPEAETFCQKGKFSAFGFRFRPPKLKGEYGRNSRKALDFFFPSVFQDENIMAWFS